ncbi:UNVERIFIED_CONTAM: putative calcium-transporting ATPase 13, plasma membrane-type [Sesamum calycinum]|uniref:Calcium-transporting ATPase 13, plasma membrane-type n=1 Tax=Sesamum calycinum TaxID=2727403 RepID=A0AAW2MLX9_9LAMI
MTHEAREFVIEMGTGNQKQTGSGSGCPTADRWILGNITDENGKKEFDGSKTKVDDMINATIGIVANDVTILVVTIPWDLPLAVRHNLEYPMRKMIADQALVRKPSARVTMGAATTICTDTTALLLSQMKVTKSFVGATSMERTSHTSIKNNSPTIASRDQSQKREVRLDAMGGNCKGIAAFSCVFGWLVKFLPVPNKPPSRTGTRIEAASRSLRNRIGGYEESP